MLMAHRIALDPNNVQATYFARAAGVARFAYNWALAEWKREYEAGGKPSEMALRRKLNSLKREQFPWMLEVTKNAPQMAVMQLGRAFKNFFAKRSRYPTFRKKGVHDRFTLTNDQFGVEGRRIRIPHLGWVRMREPLRFTGKILSATLSREADRWFVSLTVDANELPQPPKAENQGAVGVDLGVSALATLSTGETIAGPKPHKAAQNRLRRLSRSLSRKQKGSQNRKKAKLKLSRLHQKIGNVRKDALHQLTTHLTRRFELIGIEDLNVSGMVKNRCLARSVSDMGFFELRRQLEYKAKQHGGLIHVAPRWFASSKTCSCCNTKREDLPLSVREWTCAVCNTHHNRDINAAMNLKILAVSSTVSVCGEEGSGLGRKAQAKPASVKQESNTKATYA